MSNNWLGAIVIPAGGVVVVVVAVVVVSLASSVQGSGSSELERWDHNYSCIFDSYRTFTYLHIAYVPYFNISRKSPTYATTDECLDACTADCSCSAAVYDVPKDSCYHYHDLIAVQSIQLIPVSSNDTVSAYLKVQRGFDRIPGVNPYYSAAPVVGGFIRDLLTGIGIGALALCW